MFTSLSVTASFNFSACVCVCGGGAFSPHFLLSCISFHVKLCGKRRRAERGEGVNVKGN